MKITISGSVKFAKELVEIYYKLEKMGHQPMMGKDMFAIADGTSKELTCSPEEWCATKRKAIKWWHDCIKSGDALLVCNFDKNGVKNYIGGNTFLEIGFAYVNNKKVFLLNPIPEEAPYKDEIKAMAGLVIDGDLAKITNEAGSRW